MTTSMQESDPFELKVLIGVAELIAGDGSPLTWSRDADYSADEVGIHLDLTPDIPGASVTLTDYVVRDDTGSEDSVVGVQVLVRSADRVQLRAIQSWVFNLLHGRSRSTLSLITLTWARRSSGTNLGQDRNNRIGRTDNYYLGVARSTPVRT